VFRVAENLGLATAGLVGDAQVLVKHLQAELALLRMKRGRDATVRAAANLLSNILHGSRHYPYYVGIILGGHDREGGAVYSLDAAGGAIPDEFVSVGSGSPFAYGVLEDHFRAGLPATEAVDLAIRALRSSQARDSASGDGYAIAVIDSDGYRELGGEEVTSRIDKLKHLSPAPARRRE
jgi:proteasome beta subunit